MDKDVTVKTFDQLSKLNGSIKPTADAEEYSGTLLFIIAEIWFTRTRAQHKIFNKEVIYLGFCFEFCDFQTPNKDETYTQIKTQIKHK